MTTAPIGTILQGRYRVLKLLGEGGFGAVYLAEDQRLHGRQLAVKVSFNNSQEAEKQFHFEASTLARLRHASLPAVSDFFVETGGQLFLVMDYVAGQDLTNKIIAQGGPLPEKQAVAWICQVCEAVAYLHEQPQPIIHRDIKPPNIKITPEGRAVLVDFGIAKQFLPGKRTARIAKAFSPGFSPMEQYIGTTDARADVYALGATLYSLVTATVPPDAFQGRFVDKKPLPPPRQLNKGLSTAVEQVIMKAMAMEPRYRYANARELLTALQGCLQGSAVGLTCPRCGHVNRPGMRFCVRDGASLTAVSSTAAPSMAARQPTPPHLGPVVDATGARQLNRQGLALHKAEQLTQALAAYEQAVRLDPTQAVYHYNLALVYRRYGRFAEALREVQTAESLDPQDADFPQLHGRIQADLQQYTQAAAALERAIAIAPTNASLHHELFQVRLEQGDVVAAFAALATAVEQNPNNAAYRLRLARLLHMADLLDDARREAEKAVQLAPDAHEAHNVLGMVLFSLQEYRDALRAQERALALKPDESAYAANVAMDYAALGNKRKASQFARKALALDPQNQNAQDVLQAVS